MEGEHLQAGFDDPENIIDVLARDEEIPEYLRERLINSNTDVILVACSDSGERKEIPAHLFFLEGSEVFQRMFREDAFQEGVARRAEVKVREVKHLEQLLYFLYANKLNLEAKAPWSLEDLFELWALIDQYVLKPSDAKNAKTIVHARMAEEMAQLGGVGGVLGVIEKAMENCPVVCQLLEEDEVLDAFARSSETATSDEIFKAAKQAVHLKLPQVATEKLFGSLSSSLNLGSGQLLQVLAWAAEMEGHDGPTTVDWKKMRAMCLDRVTSPDKGWATEWEWWCYQTKPSVHLRVAAALVLMKDLQSGFPPCRLECDSCSAMPMKPVSHSISDDAWDLECPVCSRRLRVARSNTTKHHRVTCLKHNFNMFCRQPIYRFMCPDCGNTRTSMVHTDPIGFYVAMRSKGVCNELEHMPKAIAEMNAKHAKAIAEMNAKHAKAIAKMNAKHAAEVEELQAALAQARAELVANRVGMPDQPTGLQAAGSSSGGAGVADEAMHDISAMPRRGALGSSAASRERPLHLRMCCASRRRTT